MRYKRLLLKRNNLMAADATIAKINCQENSFRKQEVQNIMCLKIIHFSTDSDLRN